MSFENGVFVPPDIENLDFGVRRQQNGSAAAAGNPRNSSNNGRFNNERGSSGGSGGGYYPGNPNGSSKRGGNGNRNRDKYLQKKRDNQFLGGDDSSGSGGGGPAPQNYFPEQESSSRNPRDNRQRLPSLMNLEHGVNSASGGGSAKTSFNPDAAEFQPRSFTMNESHDRSANDSSSGHKNRNYNQNIGRSQQREDFRFRRRFQHQEDSGGGASGYQQSGRGGYYDSYDDATYDETAATELDVNPPRGFADRREKEKWNNRKQQRDDFNYSNGNVRGRYGSGGGINSPKRNLSKNNPTKSSSQGGRDNNNKLVAEVTEEGVAMLEKVFESKYEDRVRSKQKPDIRNQRETLSDQLSRNAYDCMICVEKVKRSNPIWTCSRCYNVFHLNCLCQWASSSKDEVGWRCPGCQSYFEDIPSEYRCFCGAMKNPSGFQSEVPHTCSQTCGRKGAGGVDCVHSCTIQCHPGPCPPCESMDSRACCCGKTSAHVKCSSKSIMTCGSLCDKVLNCGVHRCTRLCHAGECDQCAVVIKLDCYCGISTKELICDAENAEVIKYSCANPCGKLLNCKKHNCEQSCHDGLCSPCKTSPEAILSCPCGQTAISEACAKCKIPLRKSCLDTIPTCGKVCGKIMSCGEPGKNHKCSSKCHVSPKCPACPLLTSVKCRCGSKNFDIPCEKYNSSADVTCEKKCAKKRSCGKHKCNTKCCIDSDHICPVPCDRPLRCGNHRCSFLCHNGNCAPCRVVSFEELMCECGTSVIYPPIPCGTKPPQCHQPCTRTHACEHQVMHNCHSEAECPPCTFFTQKWCHGKHELRKNVMCHIQQLSCGTPCNKVLSCGRHKCSRMCHPDSCLSPNENCKKPCEIAKKDCGHNCGAACHEGACPESKCKLTVDVTCMCGRKKENMICWKREKEYDLLTTYMTNIELKKLRDVDPSSTQEEKEIDVKSVMDSMKEKTPKSNVLECDKECARVERNRKMVEALQLEDPDATSTFGTPNYSEFLISFAKKNPQLVENIHDRLTSLVVKAKRSKRKNETYGFESMNRDKRRVVHEYSDHFGCLSESFDEEPNRNVVVTASKDKSYLPAVSLVDAVFRPNICSERKNAFNDVEIFQNSKSQILRPANGKIWGTSSSTSTSKMVPLSGSSASSYNNASSAAAPVSAPPSNHHYQVPNTAATPAVATPAVFHGDFPPLS